MKKALVAKVGLPALAPITQILNLGSDINGVRVSLYQRKIIKEDIKHVDCLISQADEQMKNFTQASELTLSTVNKQIENIKKGTDLKHKKNEAMNNNIQSLKDHCTDNQYIKALIKMSDYYL